MTNQLDHAADCLVSAQAMQTETAELARLTRGQLSKGDRVRVVIPGDYYHNSTGIVSFVSPYGADVILGDANMMRNVTAVTFAASELELLKAATGATNGTVR